MNKRTVSNQLISPTSGDSGVNPKDMKKATVVSNQLISPTSGDKIFQLTEQGQTSDVSNQLISPTSGDKQNRRNKTNGLRKFPIN